ncbi:MAG: DUF4344 domain-containing metallopeptidase [Kofleriaceae bacterium]
MTRSPLARALPLVVLALVACKKSEPAAPPAPGSAGGSAAPSALGASAAGSAGDGPIAAAPTTSKLGASAGADLAKLDLGAPTAAATTTTAKPATPTDLSSIPPVPAPPMAVRGFTGKAATGFRVAYHESKNPVHEGLRQSFSEHRVFEEVAGAINQTIRIPTTVDIHLVDCDTVNAFYDPNNKRIIVCYELITYFAEKFRPAAKTDDELGTAVIGATMFSFFHELGHGLIHLLDLPSVGREEDAADQLATLILMADGDDGVQLALSGAYWFQLQKDGQNETPFWDEHSFDGQRYYNILCLIYGSDPSKYGGFLSSGALPEARAQRCPEEYGRINKAWEKLLAPHLTSTGAQNIDYPSTVPRDELDAPAGYGGAPSAPTAAGPTCETLTEHAAQLIVKVWERELEGVPADERAAAAANAQAQLPALLQQFLAECADDDWSPAVRACIMAADDVEALDRCAPEQAARARAVRAVGAAPPHRAARPPDRAGARRRHVARHDLLDQRREHPRLERHREPGALRVHHRHRHAAVVAGVARPRRHDLDQLAARQLAAHHPLDHPEQPPPGGRELRRHQRAGGADHAVDLDALGAPGLMERPLHGARRRTDRHARVLAQLGG